MKKTITKFITWFKTTLLWEMINYGTIPPKEPGETPEQYKKRLIEFLKY